MKFPTKLIFLIFLSFSSANLMAAKLNDVTIIVSSCDKYAPLWNPFFTSLFKNWPSLLDQNQEVPILLISNTKSFDNARIKHVHIPQEKSWSDNMLAALTKVQTKYVLVMLDDYWLINPVQEQRISDIVQAMQQEEIAMAQLAYNNSSFHYGTKHPVLHDAIYTNQYAEYKTSLQAAIWEVKALRFLLKPGESPWDFELAGTKRSHGYPATFINIASNYPIEYLNAARQGYVEQFALDYALENGIKFERGNLPLIDKYKFNVTYANLKKRISRLITRIKVYV